MVDLWRLLVLDPATDTWMASQPNFDQHPLSLLLASTDNITASSSRNYILTTLRLFANTFASPLIAQKFVLGPQKQKLTSFIIQTLLHDDDMVKNASASLIFNYSAALQRNRVESAMGTTMHNKSIHIDEDEDWEVEIVSAIIEALKREQENEDFSEFAPSIDTRRSPNILASASTNCSTSIHCSVISVLEFDSECFASATM